jgi:hypothetical protein
MSIRRLHPAIAPTRVQDRFRLLFVGDGYSDPTEFAAIVRLTWDGVTSVSPFRLFRSPGTAPLDAISVYYALNDGPSLGVEQQGNVLSIPASRATALRDWLAGTTLTTPDEDIPALSLWPEGGRFGRTGCLVVVLKKGIDPGELYQLAPSDNYPVPIVGVTVSGLFWHMTIVRALAQAYGGLVDEFELPGDDFRTADAFTLIPAPANVIFLTDKQRQKLAQNDQRGIQFPRPWRVVSGRKLTFHPHVGEDPVTTKQPRLGGISLVEGGAGFRFNAIRSDNDCVLRRTPLSSTLPVQELVEFCEVCQTALTMQLTGQLTVDGFSGSASIDKQRLRFDRVFWRGAKQIVAFNNPTSDQVFSKPNVKGAGPDPSWITDVQLDRKLGLILGDIRLLGREVTFDPYAKATSVLRNLSFDGLKVIYTVDGTRKTEDLSFEQAFKAPGGVVLRIYADGTDDIRLGIKAAFTWKVADLFAVDAEASFVARGRSTDLDPGGVIQGCKYFPQLALRWRRLPSAAGKKVDVEELAGNIALVMNNALRPGEVDADPAFPPELKDMVTGEQNAGVWTDSNSAESDSVYTLTSVGFPFLNFRLFPPFGKLPLLRQGIWRQGRKLAGLAEKTSQLAGAAGAARSEYLATRAPGPLPHWSWLFDYTTPIISAKKRFVGVYHRKDRISDPTMDGSADGATLRTKRFQWPPVSQQTGTPNPEFRINVRHLPRQGAYDNAHIAASHGAAPHAPPGDKNAVIVSAPFCGDVCNHLHWRWGTSGLFTGPQNRFGFYGWGSGKLGLGANRVLGAPLIPPNQHLELEIQPLSGGETALRYEVRARVPGIGQWQVFLEQGIGFAYSYLEGLNRAQLAMLAAGTGTSLQDDDLLPDPIVTLFNIETWSDEPVAVDLGMRMTFHQIYHRIRWYNPDPDDMKPFTHQTPVALQPDGFVAAPESLEKF